MVSECEGIAVQGTDIPVNDLWQRQLALDYAIRANGGAAREYIVDTAKAFLNFLKEKDDGFAQA